MNRQEYKLAKKLEEAYTEVTEEELNNKIKEVERAHLNGKYGQSWKLIKEITERKTSKKGQLEGNTQKNQLENWNNHYKNLLGNPPSITDEEEDIPSILM